MHDMRFVGEAGIARRFITMTEILMHALCNKNLSNKQTTFLIAKTMYSIRPRLLLCFHIHVINAIVLR